MEEMIELWQTGTMNYDDLGLDKPVLFNDVFLQTIANDTQSVDVTEKHSNNIIGSLSNFKYADGKLYCEKPSDIDITGNGLISFNESILRTNTIFLNNINKHVPLTTIANSVLD